VQRCLPPTPRIAAGSRRPRRPCLPLLLLQPLLPLTYLACRCCLRSLCRCSLPRTSALVQSLHCLLLGQPPLWLLLTLFCSFCFCNRFIPLHAAASTAFSPDAWTPEAASGVQLLHLGTLLLPSKVLYTSGCTGSTFDCRSICAMLRSPSCCCPPAVQRAL
jgi:hypothetical protein